MAKFEKFQSLILTTSIIQVENMNVDEHTKVIVLPEKHQSFTILSLPFESNSKKVLLSDDQLYELRQIDGNNPYIQDSKKPVIPRLGMSVKSYIFENEIQGQVISNPNLIASSKYNLIYWLIQITYSNRSKYSSRFITFDDFIDKLSSEYAIVSSLTKIIEEKMPEIFEVINEGGEVFYKLSINKIFQKLNDKVNKLFETLKKNESFSITTKIKQDLYSDVNNTEIPISILNLSILKYSIDLIFESYLNKDIKQDFIKAHKINFIELDNYCKELKEKKKSLEVIESNMNSIVQTTTKANNNRNSAKTVTKKKTTKKEVKKVAVGKGALDGFFKKA